MISNTSSKLFVIFGFTILSVLGCSSGKHHDPRSINVKSKVSTTTLVSSKISHKPIPFNNTLIKNKKQQSLFAHPGLIFGIDWGGSRASNAANQLVKNGYYDNVVEIRDRKYPLMYEQMLKEKRSSYLGIHFSLGGSPEVLSEAIKASQKASSVQDKTIVYNAILVDPYNLSAFSDFIKPHSPHLGTVYIIASSDYSFLRPRMKMNSKKTLDQHKLYYIYPKDFGLYWDHFGFLSAITDTDKNNIHSQKVQSIFYFLVNSIQQSADERIIKSGLNKLKQTLNNGRLAELHLKQVEN